jgi:S-adenosylmethionine synthetase
VSYEIGNAKPLSVYVDTYGTGKLSNQALLDIVQANFDFSPHGIIKALKLRRPIYAQTAAYGHFGRTDIDLLWEAPKQLTGLPDGF